MILIGDALSQLKTLDDQSVNMCITSPPYYGLRDYGVEGQLGLEPTVNEYIDNLCNIFDEVGRVLKPDGTCWINIGDSYNASQPTLKDTNKLYGYQKWWGQKALSTVMDYERPKQIMSSKSQIGVPERFVVEMLNRGWIKRNTIIWHKPFCIPTQAKDRFTVDFEYLFMFAKQDKYYFNQQFENDRNMRSIWRINPAHTKGAHFATYPEELITTPIKAGCPEGGVVLDPFGGSGTTGAVARKLDRDYILIELNPEYKELIDKRLQQNRLF